VFNAFPRDSMPGGVVLSKTDLGNALRRTTLRGASAILEASPSALLFGAWNSTSGGGDLGAKFTRAIGS